MKASFLTGVSVLLLFILTACGSSQQSSSFTFEDIGDQAYETVAGEHSDEWTIIEDGENVGTLTYIGTDYFNEHVIPNFEGGLHQDQIMSDWHNEQTRFVIEHIKSMDVIQRFYFIYPVDETHSYMLTLHTPTLEKEEIMRLAQSFRFD
ncbi:hypothetical protein [Alkalihalobacillus sp. AL-G]|uniref:hypothetical protein n=1 Tax=Alkalihalobacillus sp. AL-G TaxID=2926399 RepID=UPI00272D4724|nr:hypothetical protein [Alkalihalobacillus sp. AL-G]WLD93726.1 hypothetical protein MOJ78_02065 [Alkalihalobacillus sp. AL-G]